MRSLKVLGFLAAAWALLSWRYSLDPLIFGFGVFSVALVAWIEHRLVEAAAEEPAGPAVTLGLVPVVGRLLVKIPWIAYKVLGANLRVCRLLLDPRVRLRPRLLRVEAHQRTLWGKVAYSNLITLTPGTVTLDLRDDRLLVHTLDPVSAESVLNGEFDRLVCGIEGDAAPSERSEETS